MLTAWQVQPSWPGVIFATATVSAWLLFRLARRARPAAPRPRPELRSSACAALSSPEAERLQVDLHELVRDAEARLSTKLSLLQQLIVDADARIAQLESLGLDEPRRTAATDLTTQEGAKPGSPAAPHFGTSAAGRNAAVYAMADAGNSAAAIARELGTPLGEVELILSLRRRTNR